MTKLVLFFSWQMETHTTYNKRFILACIHDAVEALKTDPDTNKLEIEVLEGVTDEPGSTPPAQVIMDERIPKADIFIADLSNVRFIPVEFREQMKAANVNVRPGPNDNVLMEFGLAKQSLGAKKIIFVMNREFGSPKDDPNIIPFDIRSYRWPVEYKYNAGMNERRVTKEKKELTKDLTEAIKAVALYAVQHRQEKFRPFMTWGMWAETVPQTQPYVLNDCISAIMSEIKRAVQGGQVNVRFLGLPGLGKTRIALETFRPADGNAADAILTGRVLYANCNLSSEAAIIEIVSNINISGEEHILLLDNCSLSMHRKVASLLRGPSVKASVISISPEPEEYHADRLSGVSYQILKKEDLASVVEAIIDKDFEALPVENRNRIKEFAQGIPMMAVLLGQSAIDGEEFIGKLDDKELLDKLLGEKATDSENRKLLQTSALFNYFGFEEDAGAEFKFLAGDRNLTVTDRSPETAAFEFGNLIRHYLRREIFEQRGRFVGMRPFPLAIFLAAEWLDNCTDERVLRVITAIAQLDEPHRKHLADAFSDQMKYLGYNERAVSIITRITGPGSPFDNAEVLNTELGSRFFRSFVEVSPDSIADNLFRNFAFRSLDELKAITDGRRNLVWVLENLCFGSQTFEKGIRVLYAFAAAENETWGNNATGQFLQLFSAHLAGTEVSLLPRINIIKWGLANEEPVYRVLAVKAMARGLTFIHASRVVGAENQGMIRRKDYEPSDQELGEYWKQILDLLTNLVLTDDAVSKQAAEAIVSSIREIVLVGHGDLLIPLLNSIATFKNNDWEEALDTIRLTLNYEKGMGKVLEDEFNKLVKRLHKTDFKSKYLRALDHKMDLSPSEFFSYEAFRGYLENLAPEFLNSGLDWKETIPLFILGKQYHAFYFGKGIADSLAGSPDELKLFIDIALATLNATPRTECDPTVLGGVFRFSNENIRVYIKEKVKEYAALGYLLFFFISFEEDSFAKTNPLFKLVDEGKYGLSEFSLFRLNGPQNPDEKSVIAFCKKLFHYAKDGYKVAFQLLFGMSYLNQEKNPSLLALIKECIMHLGIFNQYITPNDYHQWWETIRMILKHETESDFAVMVNDAVISVISLENSFHLNYDIQTTYEVLMSRHFNKVWPNLSKALLSSGKDYITFYGLKNILESGISSVKRPVGVLFSGDIEQIFEWCAENSPLAPARLAELIPVFAEPKQGEPAAWHPIAKRLIDDFGEIDGVRDGINASMNTFSWTGSIEPYLQMQLSLMQSLIHHPKSEVAEWANKYVDYLKKEIPKTLKRDEEDMIL